MKGYLVYTNGHVSFSNYEIETTEKGKIKRIKINENNWIDYHPPDAPVPFQKFEETITYLRWLAKQHYKRIEELQELKKSMFINYDDIEKIIMERTIHAATAQYNADMFQEQIDKNY